MAKKFRNFAKKVENINKNATEFKKRKNNVKCSKKVQKQSQSTPCSSKVKNLPEKVSTVELATQQKTAKESIALELETADVPIAALSKLEIDTTTALVNTSSELSVYESWCNGLNSTATFGTENSSDTENSQYPFTIAHMNTNEFLFGLNTAIASQSSDRRKPYFTLDIHGFEKFALYDDDDDDVQTLTPEDQVEPSCSTKMLDIPFNTAENNANKDSQPNKLAEKNVNELKKETQTAQKAQQQQCKKNLQKQKQNNKQHEKQKLPIQAEKKTNNAAMPKKTRNKKAAAKK